MKQMKWSAIKLACVKHTNHIALTFGEMFGGKNCNTVPFPSERRVLLLFLFYRLMVLVGHHCTLIQLINQDKADVQRVALREVQDVGEF